MISFISEIQFHYVEGFMPEIMDQTIFWKAETVEALNSTTLISVGIILIIIAFVFRK